VLSWGFVSIPIPTRLLYPWATPGCQRESAPGVWFQSTHCVWRWDQLYLVSAISPQTQAQAFTLPARRRLMSPEPVCDAVDRHAQTFTYVCRPPRLSSPRVVGPRGSGILLLLQAELVHQPLAGELPPRPGSKGVPLIPFSGRGGKIFMLVPLHWGLWIALSLTAPLKPICHLIYS